MCTWLALGFSCGAGLAIPPIVGLAVGLCLAVSRKNTACMFAPIDVLSAISEGEVMEMGDVQNIRFACCYLFQTPVIDSKIVQRL